MAERTYNLKEIMEAISCMDNSSIARLMFLGIDKVESYVNHEEEENEMSLYASTVIAAKFFTALVSDLEELDKNLESGCQSNNTPDVLIEKYKRMSNEDKIKATLGIRNATDYMLSLRITEKWLEEKGIEIGKK